jgi:hypothetical protein
MEVTDHTTILLDFSILIQMDVLISKSILTIELPGFDPRSGHVGFVVDNVALGQVFSEYFGFPCQSSFHQLLHNHHHRSSGAGTIGQQWLTYQVDSVSPHPEKKNP